MQYGYSEESGIHLKWYTDNKHPWPYYEGLTCKGLYLSLLVPYGVPHKLIMAHIRKVRNSHDLEGYTIKRGTLL